MEAHIHSWDIKNFYPSISFQLIREAVGYWLNQFSHLINTRFTRSFIVDAVEITMSHNHCVFDDSHFKFIKGLATGTNAAVCLAVMVRAYLMHKVCNQLEQDGLNVISLYAKDHLKAFIDDNICLWDDSLGSIDVINRQFDRIKKTMASNSSWSNPRRIYSQMDKQQKLDISWT